MAKATAFLAAVDKTTRGFESFPSPPIVFPKIVHLAILRRAMSHCSGSFR